MIAKLSQTVTSPSTRQGTLPVGEACLMRSVVSDMRSGTSVSSNAMPFARMTIHGLSDHDE